MTLRWWASPALAARVPLPDPLPLVVYDPPCGLRDRALRRLDELGLDRTIMAESPHLSGVHAAVRNGLGYALLAAGGDGMRAVGHGPLADTIDAGLWLLVAASQRSLGRPLLAAMRAAMAAGPRAVAA
jgi:DNA-binding transcriptional LysR family regulator